MTDFDLDDPLGDLLSDGSNDSFFDPKPKKTSKPPEKKSLNDLFGLDKNDGKAEVKKPELKKPETKPELKKPDDWLGLGESSRQILPKPSDRASPTKPALKQSKKISFEDDDDILGNLGLDKTKEEKKINLMESILGTKSEPPKQDNYGFSSLDAPREGRRSRQQHSMVIKDPLGLLSGDNKPETKRTDSFSSPAKKIETPEVPSTEVLFPTPKQRELKTKSVPNIAELPNWLGGDSEMKGHKSETVVMTKHQQELPRQIQETKEESLPPTRLSTPGYLDAQSSSTLITQQKLVSSQMEYQSAAIAMQQQESQILMALQLKKYDENLTELQRKQQDVLSKQEQQFNSLLERQFAKQQIIENNLRLQQEKINSHIQMMLAQPPVSMKPLPENDEELHQAKKNNEDEKAKLYEEMIGSLKQRSHEEMFLLEESYKKQILTLEQTMDSMEKRLKTEIDALSEVHIQKYEQLKAEQDTEVQRYKAKLDEMTRTHTEEMKGLRENHNRVIEEIKYEYSTMVENIKQTKQSETSLFQNATEYSDKLDTSLKMLDTSARVLIGVRDRVESDYSVLSRAREESLKAKEEEIKLMRETLEKARESTDLERSQLLALVRSLEIRIAEQDQNGREERWALQQATAIFSAKSKALEREADYNRMSLEREREEIKTLKDSLLAEQEKMLLHLTEERLALSTERKRLETATKLSHNFDSQKGKAELEAAIQVAKEAAEMTDREREVLYQQQAEMEMLKRTLADREKKLSMREKDLEARTQLAYRKAIDGERAMEEGKNLERNFNNRMKEVQVQLSSLAIREKKLADEKIAMSKERLALHNQLMQVKKCSLCAAVPTAPRFQQEDEDSIVEQDFPQFTTVSDPDLLRLRLQYADDNFNTNLKQQLNST